MRTFATNVYYVCAVAMVAAGALAVGQVPATTRQTRSVPSELAAARSDKDRDSKIGHLRAAIDLNPDDPKNIVIEFQIATLLSQNPDLPHNKGVQLDKALQVCERIVTKYDHKHYYQASWPNSLDSPEFMVPRAAVLAASILIGSDSGQADRARGYLAKAMDAIQWTQNTRKHDWETAPDPEKSTSNRIIDSPFQDDKIRSQLEQWKQRKADAAAGKVLSPMELSVVDAAVRQYGLSYGAQHPNEVAGVMNRIIREYPDSPLAFAAQRHIDRAQQFLAQDVARSAAASTTEAASRPLVSVATRPTATMPAQVETTSMPVANTPLLRHEASRGYREIVITACASAAVIMGAVMAWLRLRRGSKP